GQFSHHVICPPPVTGLQFPASQNLPSWTEAPLMARQSFRVATAVHWFPVPVRQQNAGLASGERLPHFFLIPATFLPSAFSSEAWMFGSARQDAAVPPASAHFSSTFSRDSRYLMPAFPIPRW